MGDTDDDSAKVMNELKHLGACQAVLPLNVTIAGALCGNTETQCMAAIDNYFDNTDIDTILAGGTGSGDIINNNCKTYYLDYDFGETSTREDKIQNLKRVAKSFCKSPASNLDFVNNGLCLPQCKPDLPTDELYACWMTGSTHGIGYKTIDNPYTEGVDQRNVVVTNCCVDNADLVPDDNNCINSTEQLQANAYVALTGVSGGYPGYIENTIAADSSLRRALQETSSSDFSDSSSEFSGGAAGGGGGRTPGGGGGFSPESFADWMGLNGSAQLNETVSCLNQLFQFLRDYVVPVIQANADLSAMPNLAMLINPGYGVLPDNLPGPTISAFTDLTGYVREIIDGLGGETGNWQAISSYTRKATAVRNFLLGHIDRAGVYLDRLSTIQECLTGLAGGVAGSRRYDSPSFMDLMDAVIDNHRESNPPSMDPTAYTPIVSWGALFGTSDLDQLGSITNTLVSGGSELEVGGHVVGYTTDFGQIGNDDIANEPYLFGNYLLRRIQHCHRLVLAWRTELARYLDYVNRQMTRNIPSGPQPEPETDSGDEGGGGGVAPPPIANVVQNSLEAGVMNVDQAADLLAAASTGIAPTVTMEQALQEGTGGIAITSTGPVLAPTVAPIPPDSNVISIPRPQPEPEPETEPQSIQARSGVTIDVTTEQVGGVDTNVNIPVVDDDGNPVLDDDGNPLSYHPFREDIRPESVTLTVGGGAPVIDNSSSSDTETSEGSAADPRTPVNWDTAFERLTSPSLISRGNAIRVQSSSNTEPPPIRPVPSARADPAAARAALGLNPARDVSNPALTGRTAGNLAGSPTLFDNVNALRAAVGLDPLRVGDRWVTHLPPASGIVRPGDVTPSGGSVQPSNVPETQPPVINPSGEGDAGTEGDTETGTTTPGGRPAGGGGQGDAGTEGDTETGTTGSDYVHSRQIERQLRRRDGELRRRLTTVNYYDTANQCLTCSEANPTKTNAWVPDLRTDIYSVEGSGDTGFACAPTYPTEEEKGPVIACYDIYAGESQGLGTFGVRLPNVNTYDECRRRGGFATMVELDGGGYAPPVESYSITYQIPSCGNFDIDSDTDGGLLVCSDIPDEDTCNNSFYSYTPNGGTINTYKCVWDSQGNPSSSLDSPGAAGSGACSRYIGESTVFAEGGAVGVPNKETKDLLVNRCQWRLGEGINDDEVAGEEQWQKDCHDYFISLCDGKADRQSCIKDNICRGIDPTTPSLDRGGSPLVGTRGNFEVSPELAQACLGAPGRFGSRPNPDPGSSVTPSAMPGSAIQNIPGIVNDLCEKNGVDSTRIWDYSYNTPAVATGKINQQFFDPIRHGAPGYYCNYANVTNQLPNDDCDANLSWKQSAEEQESICETQYTSDYYECKWDPGFAFGGECKKDTSRPCGGGSNSNVYDCPSYGAEQCQMYSDHCDWIPETTTTTPGRPIRDSMGRPLPGSGDPVITTTPGVCSNKGS